MIMLRIQDVMITKYKQKRFSLNIFLNDILVKECGNL